jgi:predicted O-methyltransferase YrrM
MLHLRMESTGNRSQEDTSTPMADATRQPDSPELLLRHCISRSKSRMELWVEFIQSCGVRQMAEIGVYRGDFAAVMLQRCPGLTRYYMVDPWRHLSDWNKPSNKADSELEEFFQEAKTKTDFAAVKRVILRGKTTEVIDQIADGELDFAYIDADHTLKGIAIDLIRVYPKVRVGGFLGGDDFTRSVWEHNTCFEPTLVFPFAVYFAEAVGATIYALPYSQFCLQKTSSSQFAFVDLTGLYGDVGLQTQFAPEKLLKLAAGERFPRLLRVARKIRGLLGGANSSSQLP